MLKIRSLTWVFLALSVLFFCAGDFRVASQAPLLALLSPDWKAEFKDVAKASETLPLPLRVLDSVGLAKTRNYTLERYVATERFLRLAQEAEAQGDSEFLAFAALHLPEGMRSEIFHFGDRAVAGRPDLTWLLYHLAFRLYPTWDVPEDVARLESWLRKVETWDPENAAPLLLRADILNGQRRRLTIGRAPAAERQKFLTAIAQEMEWFGLMEVAFQKKRYDRYVERRFELVRKVLLQRGWNHPVVTVLLLAMSPPIPFGTTHRYADILVEKRGAGAEASGHPEEGIELYRKAAGFGERLELESQDSIVHLYAAAIRRRIYRRLIPALKQAGRSAEAADLELALQHAERESRCGQMARTKNLPRASWLLFSATLVWVLLILNLAGILYLIAKRWVRKEKKGLLLRVVTSAESYLAILLFIASLALSLTHRPYAENFRSYMAVKEPVHSLDSLAPNCLPTLGLGLELFPFCDTDNNLPVAAYLLFGLLAAVPLAFVSLACFVLWRSISFLRRRLVAGRGTRGAVLAVAALLAALGVLAVHYKLLSRQDDDLNRRLRAAISVSRKRSITESLLTRQLLFHRLALMLQQSPAIQLSRLAMDGSVKLDGVTDSASEVADFIAALKRSGQFQAVEIEAAYPQELFNSRAGVGFSLSAQLATPSR